MAAEEMMKNVSVNPHMLDNVQPELFSRMGSTNLGDPYKDSFRAKQLYDKEKNDMISHGQPFVPSYNRKTMYFDDHYSVRILSSNI
jgi:hypothetical protein